MEEARSKEQEAHGREIPARDSSLTTSAFAHCGFNRPDARTERLNRSCLRFQISNPDTNGSPHTQPSAPQAPDYPSRGPVNVDSRSTKHTLFPNGSST